MTDLDKIAEEINGFLDAKFTFYKETAQTGDFIKCDRHFEGIYDDGSHTFFRFLYKKIGYVGVIEGAGKTERGFAALLPAYIESFSFAGSRASQKRIFKTHPAGRMYFCGNS